MCHSHNFVAGRHASATTGACAPRGAPFVNFTHGRELLTAYTGDEPLAYALRAVAEGADFDGYHFWMGKQDEFNGNFIEAEIVKAFITSIDGGERLDNRCALGLRSRLDAQSARPEPLLHSTFFDFINLTNFGAPNHLLGFVGFGQAAEAGAPARRVQFALKYPF